MTSLESSPGSLTESHSLGGPVGGKRASISPPNGVTREDWVFVIELCAMNFSMTGGISPPEKASIRALDVDNRIKKRTWDLIFDYAHGRQTLFTALSVRGVLPLGEGLDPLQMLALEVLTDPNQGAWKTRLSKAGLSPSKFQAWMQHKPFAHQFAILTQKRINASKDAVHLSLTRSAIDGNLEAIKYFDKVVGRDPDKKQELDGRKVVGIVIDALTKHLSDQPDKLRQIAAEIEVRMKLDGD